MGVSSLGYIYSPSIRSASQPKNWHGTGTWAEARDVMHAEQPEHNGPWRWGIAVTCLPVSSALRFPQSLSGHPTMRAASFLLFQWGSSRKKFQFAVSQAAACSRHSTSSHHRPPNAAPLQRSWPAEHSASLLSFRREVVGKVAVERYHDPCV